MTANPPNDLGPEEFRTGVVANTLGMVRQGLPRDPWNSIVCNQDDVDRARDVLTELDAIDETPPPTADVSAINPQALIAAMEDAGFTNAGGRSGAYIRLRWPGSTENSGEASLIVPLDPTTADHEDLLRGVIAELRDAVARGARARAALEGMATRRASGQ